MRLLHLQTSSHMIPQNLPLRKPTCAGFMCRVVSGGWRDRPGGQQLSVGPGVVPQGLLDDGQLAGRPVQLAQVCQRRFPLLQLAGEPLHIRHAYTTDTWLYMKHTYSSASQAQCNALYFVSDCYRTYLCTLHCLQVAAEGTNLMCRKTPTAAMKESNASENGAPLRCWSLSRSRSSGSDTNASTTSCRVRMSSTETSGCLSHTCAASRMIHSSRPCHVAPLIGLSVKLKASSN